MKLEAPPSRYRVIERGGRLVVIDTVAGGTPRKAKELLPAASDSVAEPYVDYPTDDDPASLRDLKLEAPTPPRPAFAQSPVATPPPFLSNVAATMCSDKRDRDGRLQWTTARWFDAKGPRTITLSKKTEPQLGGAMLALLAGAFGAVILAVAFGLVGWVILVIAATSLPKAKPATTAWIDRLART